MVSPMTKEERIIRDYLSGLDIRYDLAGYTYLVEIVEYLLQNPTLQIKRAIEAVGSKYDASYKNVQNSIRYCVRLSDKVSKDIDAKQLIFDCVSYVRESGV